MTQTSCPGVYVDEIPADVGRIAPATTHVTLFAGRAPPAPAGVTRAASFTDYLLRCGVDAGDPFSLALRAYFENGGRNAVVLGVSKPGVPDSEASFRDALIAAFADGRGLGMPDFDVLCVPGLADKASIRALQAVCRRRRAVFLIDAPEESDVDALLESIGDYVGDDARNAALYFPWLVTPRGVAPPCGFVAGVLARMDAAHGVWKPPAGQDARLYGADALARAINDADNERLNRESVNCLRSFPARGLVVWGARTLAASDADWQYLSVRRLMLFIERSIDAGLEWVAFEPNGQPLWTRARLAIEIFLDGLFLQGAFAGGRRADAFFVRCDATTMSRADVDAGNLIVEVGVAPRKPGEFVILQFQKRCRAPAA